MPLFPVTGAVLPFFFLSENYFFSDPDINDPIPTDFLSHKEKYEQAVRKACIVYKKSRELRKAAGEMDRTRYVQYRVHIKRTASF